MKTCRKCGKTKPLELFRINPRNKAKRIGPCKECGSRINAVNKRAKKTGVGRVLFANLLAYQGGRCAVCQCPIDHTASADHCHDSGKPRGLLCRYCNVAEGFIRKIGIPPADFAQRLENYLREPPASVMDLV